MQTTGIVRKIDELGRIVIPKEMRKVLRIRCGDPLEMKIGENGDIHLSKFSEMEDVRFTIEAFLSSLYEYEQIELVLFNRDEMIACARQSTIYSNPLIYTETIKEKTRIQKMTFEHTDQVFENYQILFAYADEINIYGEVIGHLFLLSSHPFTEKEKDMFVFAKTFIENLHK